MQLLKLSVRRGDQLVREVPFKKGLNLITDRPVAEANKSGNSIGKTTVLRLIDFCLGSEGADIWQDSEFKGSINQEVFDYLHGPVPVWVSLSLIAHSGAEHNLSRSFAEKSKDEVRFLINGKPAKTVNEYRSLLKELMFGIGGRKPSLRQLIPKFVRSSPYLMSKTLKYLGDFGSEADYEAVHLFLFGFTDVHLLDERAQLKAKRRNLDRDLQALNRLRKEGEIEQLLFHLRREIEEINSSRELRGEIPEIANNANEVTKLREMAGNIAAGLSRIDSEISSIQSAISQLGDESNSVDAVTIEALYREAGAYLPKLHHDYAELAAFVKNLRGRKQRFLEKQLTSLRLESRTMVGVLRELQERESTQIGALVKSPEFAKALEVRSDLHDKLKQLGSLEQALEDIRELKSSLSKVDSRLLETRDEIEEGRALLTERVNIFNRRFSRLSQMLYGEQYLLHFEETDRGTIVFQLTAVGSNVGSGKKASQTAAFDLAYIDFLLETKLGFPTFVCHDGVESIHANQLAALLEMADASDGQLVVATLRDKLPPLSPDFLARNTVLELSQEEKFFRLEKPRRAIQKTTLQLKAKKTLKLTVGR